MARIIAFSNIKGGSGKTTTAVNIAAALAHKGRDVLLVDTDPQAHATLSLGISPKEIKSDLFLLLMDKAPIDSVMKPTYLQKLKIIPASKKLVSFEKNYSKVREARLFLSEHLAAVSDRYDYILLDTPPTISLLMFSALIAAKEVIIPVQAHFLGMKGVFDMVRLMYRIQHYYKTDLQLQGIIPTFFNDKIRLSKTIVMEIKNNLGNNVFLHPVRNNITLAEAPMFGKSIFHYSRKSPGAVDYMRIANQIESMGISDTKNDVQAGVGLTE